MAEATTAPLEWSYTGSTAAGDGAVAPLGWRLSAAHADAIGARTQRPDKTRTRRPVLDDPDRELVTRWQEGDESAFEELVRVHQARVFGLLYRMMGTREEAEDVAQETFLSLHRHGRKFRGEARFSTFVYRVAANAALNRRRSLGRSRTRVRRLEQRQAAGDDLPSAPRNPENAAEGSQITVLVQGALQRLAPSMRLPLVMYEMQGLSYSEIAASLDVAEGTVKSRIHRARQTLRRDLSCVLGEES